MFSWWIIVVSLLFSGWFYPSQALIQSQNDASAIAKLLYPQLLDKGVFRRICFRCLNFTFCFQVIVLNAPWFFKQLWKIATMVLSESLTSKVGMCGGTIVPGELGKCPWASKHLAVEDMPTFVGGGKWKQIVLFWIWEKKVLVHVLGDVSGMFQTTALRW
jgi:hypothetical protein